MCLGQLWRHFLAPINQSALVTAIAIDNELWWIVTPVDWNINCWLANLFANFSGSSAIYFSLFHRGSLRMKRIEKKSAKIPRREGSQIDSTRKVSLCLQCLMFVVLHCGRLCLGPPCANFALQFCCHSWPSMFHHALARKKCTLQKKPGGKVLILCSTNWNSWFPNIFFSGFETPYSKKTDLSWFFVTQHHIPLLFPSQRSQRSLTEIDRKTVGPTRGMRLILDGFGFPLYLGSSSCHS